MLFRSNIQKVQDDVLKLWSVVKALPEISSDQKNHIKSLYEGIVHSLNNPDSNPHSTPRSRCSSSQFLRPQVTGVTVVTSLSSDKIPLLHLGILLVFISISFMKLPLWEQPSRTRTHFSLELARVPLVSKTLKAFYLVVLTLLSRLQVIVIRLLNTTNQSSSLSAVVAQPSPSFLSIRP